MLLSFPIRQHAAKNLQHLITGNKVLIQGLNTDPVKFFTDHFDKLPAEFDSSNSHARIAAIAGVVSQGTEYIENFYFDHLREIKHNYELISSDKVDQQISNNIKNFIKSLDQ